MKEPFQIDEIPDLGSTLQDQNQVSAIRAELDPFRFDVEEVPHREGELAGLEMQGSDLSKLGGLNGFGDLRKVPPKLQPDSTNFSSVLGRLKMKSARKSFTPAP